MRQQHGSLEEKQVFLYCLHSFTQLFLTHFIKDTHEINGCYKKPE